jgi:surfactin synthase thioesterase subunit
VAKIVKQLAKELKITWNLHTVYWPQKAERMNQTLKMKISKLCQKTHLTWE